MPELVCCKLTYIEGRSFTWARLRRINLETIRHFVKFDMIVGIHRFNFDRYIAWVAVHTCLVLFGDFNFSHVKSSRVEFAKDKSDYFSNMNVLLAPYE